MTIWFADLPVAVWPLWQEAQPETMPVWLKVAPANDTVLRWQVSHGWVVTIWFADLPVAVWPLWQEAQPETMPVWLKVAPAKLTVLLWQVSHGWVVTIWFADLPVAVCPLWQEAQPADDAGVAEGGAGKAHRALVAGLARLGGDDMVRRLAGRRLPVVTTTALTRRALESTGQMAALAVDSEMRSDEREPSAEMVEDRTCTLLRICELRREPRAQRNKNCEQRLACSAFSHSSPKLFWKDRCTSVFALLLPCQGRRQAPASSQRPRAA